MLGDLETETIAVSVLAVKLEVHPNCAVVIFLVAPSCNSTNILQQLGVALICYCRVYIYSSIVVNLLDRCNNRTKIYSDHY